MGRRSIFQKPAFIRQLHPTLHGLIMSRALALSGLHISKGLKVKRPSATTSTTSPSHRDGGEALVLNLNGDEARAAKAALTLQREEGI